MRYPSRSYAGACNAADFPFECTDELAPPQGLIGQERAIRAIQFGLELDKPGYNLFVTGLTGTGKASAIKRHLESIIGERDATGAQSPISDWCYVHNFTDPDRPRILRLPPGQGKRTQQAVEDLLRSLKEELPRIFAGDEYTAQRKRTEEEGRTAYQQKLQKMEKEVREQSFGLQFSPAGVNLFPLNREGGPLPAEEFMRLEEKERGTIEEVRNRLLQVVQDTMQELKSIEGDTQKRVRDLDREVGEVALSDIFRGLTDESDDVPGVVDYLASLKEYTLNHLNLFTSDGSQTSPSASGTQTPQAPGIMYSDPLLPFEINVLVDNSITRGAPIIIESNPTWGNLFGRIERRAFMGAYFSDHTMLKPGSIHHANGG